MFSPPDSSPCRRLRRGVSTRSRSRTRRSPRRTDAPREYAVRSHRMEHREGREQGRSAAGPLRPRPGPQTVLDNSEIAVNAAIPSSGRRAARPFPRTFRHSAAAEQRTTDSRHQNVPHRSLIQQTRKSFWSARGLSRSSIREGRIFAIIPAFRASGALAQRGKIRCAENHRGI